MFECCWVTSDNNTLRLVRLLGWASALCAKGASKTNCERDTLMDLDGIEFGGDENDPHRVDWELVAGKLLARDVQQQAQLDRLEALVLSQQSQITRLESRLVVRPRRSAASEARRGGNGGDDGDNAPGPPSLTVERSRRARFSMRGGFAACANDGDTAAFEELRAMIRRKARRRIRSTHPLVSALHGMTLHPTERLCSPRNGSAARSRESPRSSADSPTARNRPSSVPRATHILSARVIRPCASAAASSSSFISRSPAGVARAPPAARRRPPGGERRSTATSRSRRTGGCAARSSG